MAMSRSLGAMLLTTRPPMLISPPLISSSPAIMRSSVDLPQPEGPTSTQNSPSAIEMSTPCTTGVVPNDLRTWRSPTSAMFRVHLPFLAVALAGLVHVPAHRDARGARIALRDRGDDRLVLADGVGRHHRIFGLR